MSHERTQTEKQFELETYCAGLPLVGSRTLHQVERTQLERRRFHLILAAVLWLVLVPILIPLSLAICLRFAVRSADEFGEPLAILGILVLFAGLPVALLRARDLVRRARKLKRTASAGSVRCFAGMLTDDDWTDLTRQALTRTGMAQVDTLNRLELLADSDVIYRLNDSEPGGWMTVELTTAAAVPFSPALFNLPSGWENQSEKVEITRRRLTNEERHELNRYAARLRKSRWVYAIPVLFVARLIGIFATKLANPEVRMNAAIVFAVAAFGFLFQRATRQAGSLKVDAEYGWLAVIDPTIDAQENSTDSETPPVVEILPLSGIAWTIAKKPASWRKHSLRP